MTLWAGLNLVLDAMAGERRGCTQGNVALVLFEEEQRPWVQVPPAQSVVGRTGMQVLPEEIVLRCTLHPPT